MFNMKITHHKVIGFTLMLFSVIVPADDAGRLYITGPISRETFESYSNQDSSQLVEFENSFGGTIGGGLKLGREISKRGNSTSVSGSCFSACAIAYLGGIKRNYDKGRQTVIMVHGAYDKNGAWNRDASEEVKRWILSRLGSCDYADIFGSATGIKNKKGGLYLLSNPNPIDYNKPKQFAFLCDGSERIKPDHCVKLENQSALWSLVTSGQCSISEDNSLVTTSN